MFSKLSSNRSANRARAGSVRSSGALRPWLGSWLSISPARRARPWAVLAAVSLHVQQASCCSPTAAPASRLKVNGPRNRLERWGGAVLQAAATAFGFVHAHPFQNGNGRLHRCLIHHVLAERRFTPAGMVFPVSSVMQDRIDDYRSTQQTHTGPLTRLPPFGTLEALIY